MYALTYPASHLETQLILRMEASPAEVGLTKELNIVLIDADGNRVEGFQVDGPFHVCYAPPCAKRNVAPTRRQWPDGSCGTPFPSRGRGTFYLKNGGRDKRRYINQECRWPKGNLGYAIS
jgi:hypothetical protein